MPARTRAALAAGTGLLALSLAGCFRHSTNGNGGVSGLSSQPPVSPAGSVSPQVSPQDQPAPTAQFPALNGKQTQITLSPAFTGALAGLHVTLAPLGPATLAGNMLRLPIDGGRLLYYRPGSGHRELTGVVDHSGGLRLAGPGATVTLWNPQLNPGTRVLDAVTIVHPRTGAANSLGLLPAFRVQEAGLRAVARDPAAHTATFSGARLVLSAAGVSALDDAFGTKAFSAGMPVGAVRLLLSG